MSTGGTSKYPVEANDVWTGGVGIEISLLRHLNCF
jgi:hypothetical protein